VTIHRARGAIRRVLSLAFCIVMLGACGAPSAPGPSDPRLELLARAFASRSSDPRRSAELFAAAGSGPTLERARLTAWHRALSSFEADARQWRELLEAHPGDELGARTSLSLARAHIREGDLEAAKTVLTGAPDSVRHEADLALVELADATTVAPAARSLALHAPDLLRAHSRTVERAALATFDDDDWIVRSAAWRAVGRGSIGAAELRGLSFGDAERTRRLELARCELEAGSPGRALAVLPPRALADPEELVVRAEAGRRRGWSRFPDRAAESFFGECLEDARLAARSAKGATLEHALTLMLECGTESRELDEALGAWRALEAAYPGHERRSWLGRRLGLALVLSGAAPETVGDLASALPDHRRCLWYWQAAVSAEPAGLEGLAADPIADLYGVWAARAVGAGGREAGWVQAPATGGAEPGFAVAWLLEAAGVDEASQEWQRQLAIRRPTAAEAVAAAELAARAGKPNTAIRTLLAGFPELGSVGIAAVPVDATRAYLPLVWADHLATAADETGLEPWLIAALARQESTFVADAVSPAGARGVLQLLPSTAQSHARALGLGSRPDLADPAVNIRIGARELARLVRAFGAVEPALAAYNAGEGRVRRWQRRWPDPRMLTESLPIPETYTYVRRVVFLAEAYRQVYADAWKETP
jgi:soluble lytic murein transglycosylase-like protein